MKDLKRNEGITLIALIITIIILVILAAVSVRAITNMKIVEYATNGSKNYVVAGKEENKMLDDAADLIDNAVEKINEIEEGGLILDCNGGYTFTNKSKLRIKLPKDEMTLEEFVSWMEETYLENEDPFVFYMAIGGIVYRPKYTCKGILDENDNPFSYEKITNNTVLKINWQDTNSLNFKFIVTVNGNGGHLLFPSGSIDSITYYYIGLDNFANHFVRDGYTIATVEEMAELYFDPECTEQFVLTNYSTEEEILALNGTTFYVKWIPNE